MTDPRAPRSLAFIVTSEMTATTFLKGYLKSLRERGFDVTLIASSEGRLETFARDEGVTAVSVPMHREPSPKADLASLRALTTVLWRVRPEIVVTATPKASLLGMLAAAATRVPVRVYQVWGLRAETETGTRRLILGSLERLTLRLATHIVANSASLAQEVRALAKGRRIDVVGQGSSHGVDLERFDRAHALPSLPTETMAKLATGQPVVGTVGRVHRDKDILTLLEAMRRVSVSRPATLLVVGPGEDDQTEAELARDHCPLSVVRVGTVTDPRPWFVRMDVHVLPTLREGFPNVVLEAAALGVPTITTTATGARDSVIHEQTGLLVTPSDPGALADAIEALLADPARQQRYAHAARLRVEQSFRQEDVWRLQGEYLETARVRGRR